MTHDPTNTRADAGRVRFDALIAQRMRESFAWGRNDCCLFPADAVAALTGIDHAAAWRGTYSDAMGAARVLQQLGGLDALASKAGPEIAPLAAAVGDVGLVVHEGRALLAVCAGEVWLAPTAGGLAALAMIEARRAWRVKHG